jgi:hypothetical protein
MDRLLQLLKRGLFHKQFKIRLPSWYFALLLVSMVIFLLYIPFNILHSCINWQGTKICSPTGSIIAILLSLPGYAIAGFLPRSVIDSNWIISFFIVVIVSVITYSLLGMYLDYIKSKNNQTRIKIIFITIFLILVFAAGILMMLTV